MVIKAIIWDLGGVLVRTENQEPRNTLAQKLGLSREGIEHIVFNADDRASAQLGEIDGDRHMTAIGEKLGLSLVQFKQTFFGGDRVDFELVDYIRGLRPKFKTALLSNALSNLRSFLMNEWNIRDAFDVIIVSAEEKLLKPDPRIYTLTLEKLEVKPLEAIFIDDNLDNVEGAQRVGIRGIQFISREQTIGDLQTLLKIV